MGVNLYEDGNGMMIGQVHAAMNKVRAAVKKLDDEIADPDNDFDGALADVQAFCVDGTQVGPTGLWISNCLIVE